MWWYAPTLASAIILLAVSWWIGRAPRGGPGNTILAPWVVIACWVIVAAGGLPILARAAPASTPTASIIVQLIAIGLITPIAVLLITVWRVARRPYDRSRCSRCGHQLIESQTACPECGDERRISVTRTFSERLESLWRDRPILFGSIVFAQQALLLTAFVAAALLFVPTPRTVVAMRQSGTASGATPSYQYAQTLLLNAKVKTSASFLLTVPFVPSDVALEFQLDGSLSTHPEGSTNDPSQPQPERIARPLLLTRDIRSVADVEVLRGEVEALTAGLEVPGAQHSLTGAVDACLMFARDQWPNPASGNATSLAAALDRASAPSANDPLEVTVGIPFVVGLLCTLIALNARRKQPAGAVSHEALAHSEHRAHQGSIPLRNHLE